MVLAPLLQGERGGSDGSVLLFCFELVMHNNVVAKFLSLRFIHQCFLVLSVWTGNETLDSEGGSHEKKKLKIDIRCTKLLFSYMFERCSSGTDLSVSLCLDSAIW